MSIVEFAASKITCASHVLEEYLAEAVPRAPVAPTSSQERHLLLVHARSWRRKADEFRSQIEELKNAKMSCERYVSATPPANRDVARGEVVAAIDRTALDNYIIQASTRLRVYNALIEEADAFLEDNVRGGGGARGVMLPKLSLKQFNGSNWDEFWPLYCSAIHEDADLDAVQKMSYLNSLLEGEATRVIQGLVPFTALNYQTAIALLKDKYGKSENLLRDLHNKLAQLPEARSVDDDAQNQLELERLCRQLENYGQDLSSPQIYLSLEQKLSKKVLEKYLVLKEAKGNIQWTTTSFRENYQKAIEQCRMIKEIYRRGGKVEKFEKRKPEKSVKAEPADPSMNFVVRQQEQRSTQRREWREPRSDRSNSRSSRSSSDRSRRESRNSRDRKGSPWPKEGGRRHRMEFDRDKSKSPSRSPSRSPARYPCALCQGIHFPLDCEKYKTNDERRNQIRALELCYMCLKKGHMVKDCPNSRRRCFLCNGSKHNPAVCEKRYVRKSETSAVTLSNAESSDTSEESDTVVSATQAKPSSLKKPEEIRSLMKCARVTIYNPLKPKVKKRVTVFLDDGSEKSYISKALAEELQLEELSKIDISISGLGGMKLGTHPSAIFEFGLQGKSIDMLMRGRSLDRVMPKLQRIDWSQKDVEMLMTNKVKLKPKIEEPQVLIGGDFYNHLGVNPLEQLANGFFISSSKLGMLISGEGKIQKFNNQPPVENSATVLTASVQEQTVEFDSVANGLEDFNDDELSKMVERHHNLEAVGLSDANRDDNEMWMKDFTEKLSFRNGRYVVNLSWNEEVERLADNYYLALGRLRSNRRKLMEKPQLMKQYHEIMMDQLDKGIIEKAPPLRGNVLHYLPHHGIERQDKQFTKIRIVFDASSKTRKDLPSLNECLHKGPKLYNDLSGIIMRARLQKYLLTCDVEKAFLQISIAEEDRDALRFLWYDNPEDENSPIVEYRFTRVTFGVICSPAHLAIVLSQHYKNYNDVAVRSLEANTYVDNILSGLDDPLELLGRYELLKKIFREATMNVREFTSNAWREIQQLPKCDRTDEELTKLLGLRWNVKEDWLAVKLKSFPEDKPVTNRTMLSQTATPYDLLGIICAVILKAKLIIQKAQADKKLKWDTPVNPEIEAEWRKLMTTWSDQLIKVPRLYGNFSKKNVRQYELHGFSDASIVGLGCAIYLRVVENDGTVHNNLVFAKALVIPASMNKKHRTIPSLELHAMRILCNNIEFVKRELEKEIPIHLCRLWTDAADVVDFLKTTKEKDRFIKNRVKAIRKFRVTHVAGTSNPADIASRGCTPDELVDNLLWFKGPEWLSKPENEWPESIKDFDPTTFVLEEKNEPLIEMSMATKQVETIEPLCDFTRFSQWQRIRNAMAYVLKAIECFKNRITQGKLNKTIKELIKLVPPLSVEELREAENLLLEETQTIYPPDESSIINLGLFQEEGIWRAKGRIQNSGVDPDTIHPIFLPSGAPITKLIIRDMHRERKHAGTLSLTSAIRERFWIPSIRRTIINVIKHNKETRCYPCSRFYAKAYAYPEAPPLPACRISGNSIWETVGVDCFGPMTVRGTDGKSKQKIWGAIFVCAVTRMVHLEIVTDASAEKFLLAFLRFARRWRVPARMISDYGGNFVLGEKALQKLCQENAATRKQWLEIYQDRQVQDKMSQMKIEWIFITPFAPFRGGQYERMNFTVKYHLKRAIGRRMLSFEEILTLFFEVERIVNERPITHTSESEVIKALRPIDLALPWLKDNKLDVAPEPIDMEDPEYFAKRSSRETLIEKHKKSLIAVETLWKDWKADYLLSLRESQKGCASEKGSFPKVGDVVLLEDINAPRNLWRIGLVTEMLSSRTARVKIGKNFLERATKQLYPLELECQRPKVETPKTNENGDKQIEELNFLLLESCAMDNEDLQEVDAAQGDEEMREDEAGQVDNVDECIVLDDYEEEDEQPVMANREENKPPVRAMEGCEPDRGRVIRARRHPRVHVDDFISVMSTIWFLGDHFVEHIAGIYQAQGARGMISKREPADHIFWTSLPDNTRLGRQLTHVVICVERFFEPLHRIFDWLQYNRLYVYYLGRLPPDTRVAARVISLDGKTWDEVFDELVAEGIPFERQKGGHNSRLFKAQKRALEDEEREQNQWREQQPGPSQPRALEERVRFLPVMANHEVSLRRPKALEERVRVLPVMANHEVDLIPEPVMATKDFRHMSSFPQLPSGINKQAGAIVRTERGELFGFFSWRYLFSNFNQLYAFRCEGQTWSCIEQLYTHKKAAYFGREEEAEQIKKMQDPKEMKRLAYLKPQEHNEWHKVRVDLMRYCLRAKFELAVLEYALLSTGRGIIVETSTDAFWGVGKSRYDEPVPSEAIVAQWQGENQLGRLLMELRDEKLLGQGPSTSNFPANYPGKAVMPIQERVSFQQEKAVMPVKQTRAVIPMQHARAVMPAQSIMAVTPGKELENLEEKIKSRFYKEEETKLELDEKWKIVDALDKILNREYDQVQVLPFGSVMSRLSAKNSDVDLFVFLLEDRENRVTELHRMKRIIRPYFEWKQGKDGPELYVIDAKCPLLRGKMATGLKMDLTIGHTNTELRGLYNSIFFNTLGRVNEQFRQLFFVMKWWGRYINDCPSGTFNSFTLALLCATYMVKRSLLPNLFKLFPDTYQEDRVDKCTEAEHHKNLISGLSYGKGCRVIDIFIGLISWLKSIDFSKQTIVSRDGLLRQREPGEIGFLVVIEPFWNHNTATALRDSGWRQITEMIDRTSEIIERQSWNELTELLGFASPPSLPVAPVNLIGSLRGFVEPDIEEVRTEQQPQPFPPPPYQIVSRAMKMKTGHDEFGLKIVGAGDEDYSDEEPEGKRSKPSNSGSSQFVRTYKNSKYTIGLLCLLSLLCLPIVSALTPMICHGEMESKFVRISRDKSACLGLSRIFEDQPKSLKLSIYRPDQQEYRFEGTHCSVVKQSVTYWTNLWNDPFDLKVQESLGVSKEACIEMARTRECKYGRLFGDPSTVMSTEHQLEYKHSYLSWGKSTAEVINCFVRNIEIIGRPGSNFVGTSIDDISHCHYSDSACHLHDFSVITWTVESGEGTYVKHHDNRRCVFKKFSTRNGTLYRSGWISEDSNLALTFDENPKTVTSCQEKLVISQQGFAVEKSEYENLAKFVSLGRKKRFVSSESTEPLDGEATVDQVQAGLQARSMFADRQLHQAFISYSNMICEYISDSMLGTDYTHLNPTLLIRQLANNDQLQGRWAAKDIIEFWPCTYVVKYNFAPKNTNCYDKIPINVTIGAEDSPVIGFLDPITLIIEHEANLKPCETFGFQLVVIEGQAVRVNQLTGRKQNVNSISELSVHMKTWQSLSPPTDLQLFRKLIITNLSHPQLDLLRSLKSFRSQFNSEALKNSGGGSSSSSTSIDEGFSIGSLAAEMWERIDMWKYFIRTVIMAVVANWVFKVYWYLSEWRTRRLLRKEMEKAEIKELALTKVLRVPQIQTTTIAETADKTTPQAPARVPVLAHGRAPALAPARVPTSLVGVSCIHDQIQENANSGGR